jgi:hypothetical protein
MERFYTVDQFLARPSRRAPSARCMLAILTAALICSGLRALYKFG